MSAQLDDAHRLLTDMPRDKRVAALALLALPPSEQLCEIGGPCTERCDDPEQCDEDHPIVGILTADRLLDELVRGIAAPDVVTDVLAYYNSGHRSAGPSPRTSPRLRVVQ